MSRRASIRSSRKAPTDGLAAWISLSRDHGHSVDGFQISLGGALGENAGFGRKLRGLKTTSADLPDYVERVVRRWLEQREDDEAFATRVARADEDDLR